MKILQFPAVLAIFLLLKFEYANSEGKYSKAVNQPSISEDFHKSEKPFRMNKINLVWAKAKQRLGEEKLKTLGAELVVHDREELKLKKVKADGLDKEGLKEAEVRKRFHTIMNKYNLLKSMDEDTIGHQPRDYNDPLDKTPSKIFKDKKLNKLWEKAEISESFSVEELMTLKQEFQHYQEKVDEYYQLLNVIHKENETSDQLDNTIDQYLTSESKSAKSTEERLQSLREKHVDLKNDYDRLNLKAVSGSSVEFKDHKVKILWKLAKETDFNDNELESLKIELEHYEQRVVKLNHLEAELSVLNDKFYAKPDDDVKTETRNHMSKKVKQMGHKVNKLHKDIETRIRERHSEL